VAHGVQANHVGGTEGTGLGTAQLGAGQVVDHVDGQAELLGFVDDGQDAEHANAVSDEVRGVLGADHALAQHGSHEGFQLVQDFRLGVGGRDQFHQVHVARWVEEVHAAEARLQVGVEAFGQLVDRQAGGVGGEDRVLRNVRSDLLVQVMLPVHAFGDRFDDQVAAGQQVQVVFVVGDLHQFRVGLVAERSRGQFFQAFDGLDADTVLVAFLGWQVKQDDWYFGVDAVGSDLRTHHAGAQHRYFFHVEVAHIYPLVGISVTLLGCWLSSLKPANQCQTQWV